MAAEQPPLRVQLSGMRHTVLGSLLNGASSIAHGVAGHWQEISNATSKTIEPREMKLLKPRQRMHQGNRRDCK